MKILISIILFLSLISPVAFSQEQSSQNKIDDRLWQVYEVVEYKSGTIKVSAGMSFKIDQNTNVYDQNDVLVGKQILRSTDKIKIHLDDFFNVLDVKAIRVRE